MMIKFNYFSMLMFNPWPMIVSLNIFNLIMGFTTMLKYNEYNLMLMSLIVLVMSCFMWFKDLNSELNFVGMNTINLNITIKMFFILFILSETMIFFSMFWCYYSYFLVSEMITMNWPHYSIKTFDWTSMPMLNTLILISSSITLTMSHYFLNNNMIKKSNNMMIMTILMGMTFTLFQSMEYKSSFYCMNDSSFGSIFFVLTGLHGIHVILGTLILISCLMKMLKMNSFKSDSESMEMSSWYWHFVDLVWIFVLYSLYYLN